MGRTFTRLPQRVLGLLGFAHVATRNWTSSQRLLFELFTGLRCSSPWIVALSPLACNLAFRMAERARIVFAFQRCGGGPATEIRPVGVLGPDWLPPAARSFESVMAADAGWMPPLFGLLLKVAFAAPTRPVLEWMR